MSQEKYIPLSQVVHAFERLQNLHKHSSDMRDKDKYDAYSSACMHSYETAMDILLGSIPLLSKEVSE